MSTSADRKAVVTGPGEGEAYWFYGDLAVIRSPDGALPVVIEHHLHAMAATPLHAHVDVDDSFFVIKGALACKSGEQTFVARAGDYVSMPDGVQHALHAIGDEDVVILQTHKATSFRDFIRAVGTPVEKGRPDPATLDYGAMNVVAGQTGQPVYGPPMSDDEAASIAQASSR